MSAISTLRGQITSGGAAGLPLPTGFLTTANDLSDVVHKDIGRANLGAAASGANVDLTGLLGLINPGMFASRSAAQAAAVPAAVARFRVDGFRALGDGGGATYARVAVLPTNGFGFISADGAVWQIVASPDLTARAFGARADALTLKGAASIAANSVTLTVANAAFTPADIGKSLCIPGAGASSAAPLATTIVSVSNATTVVLAAAAGTAVVSGAVTYGTDDRAAIQALLYAFAGGVAQIGVGQFYVGAPLYVPDSTFVSGAGVFGTVIRNVVSEGFRNAGYTSGTANVGIAIENIGFDAGGSGASPISMTGVSQSAFRRIRIANLSTAGVTVGVGIGAKPGLPCASLSFLDLWMDVPDYGIVLDSGSTTDGSGTTTYGAIQDVTITNLRCTTHWGTGISLAKDVRNVAITGCVFHMPGDDLGRPQVGIGIKLWSGIDVTRAPSDITVAGCVFIGASARIGLFGVSAANWANNLTMTGNTFRNLSYAFYNNFSGTGATNLVFANNTVRTCDYGVFADNSQDTNPSITGNTFTDISADAINIGLNYSVVSGNKFANIVGKGVRAQLANCTTFASNQFYNIGEEAIYMVRGGSTNSLCVISGNSFEACGGKTDNTFNVIQLNDQPHTVSSNTMRYSLGGNLPMYVIGRTTNSANCVFTGNWMYGARAGYLSIAAQASDVYVGNKERGGIG